MKGRVAEYIETIKKREGRRALLRIGGIIYIYIEYTVIAYLDVSKIKNDWRGRIRTHDLTIRRRCHYH